MDNLTTTSGLGFEFALVLLPLMWFGGGARRFWRKGLLLPRWREDHLEQDCAAHAGPSGPPRPSPPGEGSLQGSARPPLLRRRPRTHAVVPICPEQKWTQWATGGKGGVDKPPTIWSKDRHTKKRNTHPTVKPVNLMCYLARLITPPGGIVLDCFMGSGSTGVAAIREGLRLFGIDREAEWHETAEKQIKAELRRR